MHTTFIFTHLIMIGAISIILYTGLAVQSEKTGIYTTIPVFRKLYLLRKCKAFGCSLQARVIVLSGQISRLKILNRLTRRSGQIV
jgi:hypothetical protein